MTIEWKKITKVYRRRCKNNYKMFKYWMKKYYELLHAVNKLIVHNFRLYETFFQQNKKENKNDSTK